MDILRHSMMLQATRGRPRESHHPAFKAQVAVAGVKARKTRLRWPARLARWVCCQAPDKNRAHHHAIMRRISRGRVCDRRLKLMHRLDLLHTELSLANCRMLQDLLGQEGFKSVQDRLA